MIQEEALENEGDYFDAIVDDDDIGHDEDELLIQEREMLEEMPLPGRTESEAERKKKWLAIPRPARAAIRRMHNQFVHKLNEPLFEILKASNAPAEYLEAAKYLRCADCDRKKILPTQTTKVSMPPPYEFNHTLGVDVLYQIRLTTTELHTDSSTWFVWEQDFRLWYI